MTQDQQEWNYRYSERLGILCGSDTPTENQKVLARTEADRWLKYGKPGLLEQFELEMGMIERRTNVTPGLPI